MRLKIRMPTLNKEQFVLDSSFLIALIDREDVHHPRAKEIFFDIEGQEGQIFLSDVLINEVLSVLARRSEERKKGEEFKELARLFQKRIQELPIVCLYELLPKYIPQVISLMVQHNGCFNFHDALFIFFLRQLPKVHFVTFDKDFSKIGNIRRLPV